MNILEACLCHKWCICHITKATLVSSLEIQLHVPEVDVVVVWYMASAVSVHVTYRLSTRGPDVLCEVEANSVWWSFVSPSGRLIKGVYRNQPRGARDDKASFSAGHWLPRETRTRRRKKTSLKCRPFILRSNMSRVWIHGYYACFSVTPWNDPSFSCSLTLFCWKAVLVSRLFWGWASNSDSARQQHEQPCLSLAWGR